MQRLFGLSIQVWGQKGKGAFGAECGCCTLRPPYPWSGSIRSDSVLLLPHLRLIRLPLPLLLRPGPRASSSLPLSTPTTALWGPSTWTCVAGEGAGRCAVRGMSREHTRRLLFSHHLAARKPCVCLPPGLASTPGPSPSPSGVGARCLQSQALGGGRELPTSSPSWPCSLTLAPAGPSVSAWATVTCAPSCMSCCAEAAFKTLACRLVAACYAYLQPSAWPRLGHADCQNMGCSVCASCHSSGFVWTFVWIQDLICGVNRYRRGKSLQCEM